MSSATLPAVRNGHASATAIPSEDGRVSLETMEQVVVGGDLSRLSPKQRLEWYRGRCEAAGLDPRTQPFQYLSLSGKLTLYATKTATDQLIQRRSLKVEILGREFQADLGIYEVQCRVTPPDGQYVEDLGALNVAGLKGEALANAVMKCVTKAKRRTVLSACGLGMLDESEVETIRDARKVEVAPDGEIVGIGAPADPATPPDNGSGHGRGQYASPEQVEIYRKALVAYLDKRNTEWADVWQLRNGGEPIDGIPELINPWRANGHLVKWAVNVGLLDATILPERLQARQRDNYPAIVYHRSADDRKALTRELARYVDEEARQKTEKVYRQRPDLDPDGGDAPEPDPADASQDVPDDLSDTEGGRMG